MSLATRLRGYAATRLRGYAAVDLIIDVPKQLPAVFDTKMRNPELLPSQKDDVFNKQHVASVVFAPTDPSTEFGEENVRYKRFISSSKCAEPDSGASLGSRADCVYPCLGYTLRIPPSGYRRGCCLPCSWVQYAHSGN